MLASRLIDRPIRPLFPSDLRNDVVVTCTVMSVDHDCSPEIAAMIGASAACPSPTSPGTAPSAAVEVGYVDGKIVMNPTQRAEA